VRPFNPFPVFLFVKEVIKMNQLIGIRHTLLLLVTINLLLSEVTVGNESKKEMTIMDVTSTDQMSKTIVIDLMYIDLTVCGRCLGTEKNLTEALDIVRELLEHTGVEVELRKTHVESEEQARRLRFTSSPTIRVNDIDIALEFKESTCSPCTDICGTDTDCRVWVYKGKEYTEAPKGMIIDAILRTVYGSMDKPVSQTEYSSVPENLKEYFKRKSTANKQQKASKASCGEPRSCNSNKSDTAGSSSCCPTKK
jgi:hypothetical protein